MTYPNLKETTKTTKEKKRKEVIISDDLFDPIDCTKANLNLARLAETCRLGCAGLRLRPRGSSTMVSLRRREAAVLAVLVAVGMVMTLLSYRVLEGLGSGDNSESAAADKSRREELLRGTSLDRSSRVQAHIASERIASRHAEIAARMRHENLNAESVENQNMGSEKINNHLDSEATGRSNRVDLETKLNTQSNNQGSAERSTSTKTRGGVERRRRPELDDMQADDGYDDADDDDLGQPVQKINSQDKGDDKKSSTKDATRELELYLKEHTHFPVILICYNRHELVRQTLKSLLEVRGIHRDHVLVIQDGHVDAVTKVVEEAGVSSVQRPDELVDDQQKRDAASRISQHYKYAMTYALDYFSDAPGVIIVEDDFLFSPDFLDFFSASAQALIADPTLWLASAWNDNGFQGNVIDKKRLLRTDYFPGLGWLLMRSLWQELEPKWPKDHWDWFMRDPANSKHREVIYPEVPRDHHTGTTGSFMDANTHKQYFDSIAHNTDSSFHWPKQIFKTAIVSAYDARVKCSIKAGIHLDHGARLQQDYIKNLPGDPARPLVVWINADPHPYKERIIKRLTQKLNIWHQLLRGSRQGVHEFWRFGRKIIMVNTFTPGPDICKRPRPDPSCEWFHGFERQSPFAQYKPENVPVFRPMELTDQLTSKVSLESVSLPTTSFEECPP